MHIINLKTIKKISNPSYLLTFIMGLVIFFSFIFYFTGDIKKIIGMLMLLFSIVFFVSLFFKTFHKKFFSNPSNIILTETLLLIMIFIVIIIKFNPNISFYFVPVGALGILLTVLSIPVVAVIGVFIISLFVSIIAIVGDFSLIYFYVCVAGGLAGIYSSLNVRNRRDLNKCGLYILFANILTITAFSLLSGSDFSKIGIDIGWGAGNALVSIIIASGLLPIIESIFGITTNIRLLELGDFNQSLLKRLMLEAPGTYHHSIMVANLSENACEKIGANPLLSRVGAYYHDIGKLKNPQYFIENQMSLKDKHKKLKPNISALILKRHVKDGLALAEEYKLDKVIKDMIPQHHGRTLIEYFYKKVIEEVKDPDSVDEKDYRYPGPRPRTKEAGVLMLADSVEAACRTLEEPTYSRIAGLVTKVINNKFIDKQLNNCDITLASLEKIQQSFINTLAAIYHSRIEYPEDKEENN